MVVRETEENATERHRYQRLGIFATFAIVLTPFYQLWMLCSHEWILLDGMGVVCEVCNHHGVIGVARMRIC